MLFGTCLLTKGGFFYWPKLKQGRKGTKNASPDWTQSHLKFVRTAVDENLRSPTVQMKMENSSYFAASRHKLSAFFSLICRFLSFYHPFLASALPKIIMQDQGNRVVVGKDETAVRQLISMISSDNRRVVCVTSDMLPFLSSPYCALSNSSDLSG